MRTDLERAAAAEAAEAVARGQRMALAAAELAAMFVSRDPLKALDLVAVARRIEPLACAEDL